MTEQEPKDRKIIGWTVAALISLGLLIYNYLSMWDMTSTVCLLVVVLVLFGFTLAEGKGDERETYHRLLASRIGFLVGLAVLTLGIVVELIVRHQNATWLIYALATMSFGKIIGLIYGRLKH